MWIKRPQQISERITFLGDSTFSTYLIRGEKTALFDGAVTAMAPVVYQQLQSMLGSSPRLDYLLVSHSHFDHVGMIPYLKRMIPNLAVVASPVVREIFANPVAVKHIRDFNEEYERLYHRRRRFPHYDVSFGKDLVVDQVVREGDVIDLGARQQLEVMEFPGHSRCSVGYWMSEQETLFVGDSLGTYNAPDSIFPEFLQDYYGYRESLEKMAKLRPRRIGLAHFGMLQAFDLSRVFDVAIEKAAEFYDALFNRLKRQVPHEKIYQELQHLYYRDNVEKQPRRLFVAYLRAMLTLVDKDYQVYLESLEEVEEKAEKPEEPDYDEFDDELEDDF